MINHSSTRRAQLIILVTAIASGLAVLFATSHGPWVKSDSVEYIAAAQNFLAGHGLTVATAAGHYSHVTLHPPLYSLFLALQEYLGADVLDAARWSGAVLMVATNLILGLGILSATGRSIPAICASLTLASASTFLHVYAGVMSEALFFPLCIGGLLASSAYIKTGHAHWLLSAAMLFAASTLDRFVGLAATGAATFAILLIGRGSLRHRAMAAVGVSLVSIVPLVVWRLSIPGAGSAAAGQLPSLTPAYLWNQFEPLRGAFVSYIWDWNVFALVLPGLKYGHKSILLLAAAIVLGVTAVVAVRRTRRDHSGALGPTPSVPLLLLLWLFGLFYVAFYCLSSFQLRFELNIDERLLSPLWLAVVLTAIVTATLVTSGASQQLVRWGAPIIATLVFIVPATVHTPALLSRLHREGEGYTGSAWSQSAIVKEASLLSRDVAIITNESAAVLFLTGRPCYEMAEASDPGIRSQSGIFGDDPSDPAQALFKQGKAALVLFDSAYWQLWPKYGDRTQQRLEELVSGLEVSATGHDGSIYFYH